MPDKSGSTTILFGYVAVTILFFLGMFAYAKWGPALPLSVNQITTTKNNLFTVSADGKTFVKPDIADVSIGFTASGTSVTQVQTQANQTINKITADIKQLGIADADIKTTNYNLRPNYNYNSGSQQITGYVVDVNLDIKVRDFAKVNSVIDTATSDGANQVGGVNFTLDDPTLEKAESEARNQAIDKAKQKAEEIASQTGITLGRIIDVQENNAAQPRPYPMVAMSAGKAAGTPDQATQVQPGQNEVDITVSLSYETR